MNETPQTPLSLQPSDPGRRPLTSRQNPIMRHLAKWLSQCQITPNQISLASLGFALIAAGALMALPLLNSPVIALLVAIVGIQLRLLCNLIDGMVAVEGGKQTVVGELYNDIPDRFADLVLLVALGVSIGEVWATHLAWLCAALAVFTAYLRYLGKSCTGIADFSGPMAKPHRMAVLTAALGLSQLEYVFSGTQGAVLKIALLVIAVGLVITIVRRINHLAATLKSQNACTGV